MRFTLSCIFKNFDFKLQPEADMWIERSENYFFWEKPPLLRNRFRPAKMRLINLLAYRPINQWTDQLEALLKYIKITIILI
jgi:hypothetical protein